MIAWLIAATVGNRWCDKLVRGGLIVTVVVVFLLSIRRAGERADGLLERLETTEDANDIQRGRLGALV